MKRIGVLAVLTASLLLITACSVSRKTSQAPQDDMISETLAAAAENEAAQEDVQAAPEVPDEPATEEVAEEPAAEDVAADDSAQLIQAQDVEHTAMVESDVIDGTGSGNDTMAGTEDDIDEGDNTIAREGNTATATQPVFIRSDPSAEEGNVVGGVPLGGVVTVLSVDQWGWYYIEYEGITGYSYGEYFD